MRFLVDNQLPTALARWLSALGHDAIHVLDRSLGQADDRELWNLAITDNRILISKDEDFFHLSNRSEETGSLIWLRVGNCRKTISGNHF